MLILADLLHGSIVAVTDEPPGQLPGRRGSTCSRRTTGQWGPGKRRGDPLIVMLLLGNSPVLVDLTQKG